MDLSILTILVALFPTFPSESVARNTKLCSPSSLTDCGSGVSLKLTLSFAGLNVACSHKLPSFISFKVFTLLYVSVADPVNVTSFLVQFSVLTFNTTVGGV